MTSSSWRTSLEESSVHHELCDFLAVELRRIYGRRMQISERHQLRVRRHASAHRVFERVAGLQTGMQGIRVLPDWSHLRENFSLDDLIATGAQFRTIYADPPWTSGDEGLRRRLERHYPTMHTDDICALPIAQLADENAMLHIWVPPAIVLHCHKVIDAWGFRYQTQLVRCRTNGWDGSGFGNWWRTGHKLLFLAIRGFPGAFRRPAHISVFTAPRGRHSEKPAEIRTLLERVCQGPFLELFAREQVHGWTCWGIRSTSRKRQNEGQPT